MICWIGVVIWDTYCGVIAGVSIAFVKPSIESEDVAEVSVSLEVGVLVEAAVTCERRVAN